MTRLFKPNDIVRMKKKQSYLGLPSIAPKDYTLFTDTLKIDTVGPMPLDEDENHQGITVKGYPYLISSHDVELIKPRNFKRLT